MKRFPAWVNQKPFCNSQLRGNNQPDLPDTRNRFSSRDFLYFLSFIPPQWIEGRRPDVKPDQIYVYPYHSPFGSHCSRRSFRQAGEATAVSIRVAKLQLGGEVSECGPANAARDCHGDVVMAGSAFPPVL